MTASLSAGLFHGIVVDETIHSSVGRAFVLYTDGPRFESWWMDINVDFGAPLDQPLRIRRYHDYGNKQCMYQNQTCLYSFYFVIAFV